MVGQFKGYGIVESELFSQQKMQLGDAKVVDEAIRVSLWAMSNKPEMFSIVPGTQSLRIAKTEAYQRGRIYVRRLRIWFVFHKEAQEIELLSIEENEDPPEF